MQPKSVLVGGEPGTLWISPRVFAKETTMTAIGVVGTEAGFVIGADGRITLEDESQRAAAPAATLETESESGEKIFEITDKEKTLAYAVAGFVKIGDFNVLEVLKRKMTSLSNRHFDTCKKYFEAVVRRLTDELNEAKGDKQIDKLPTYRKTEAGDGWKILESSWLFQGLPVSHGCPLVAHRWIGSGLRSELMSCELLHTNGL